MKVKRNVLGVLLLLLYLSINSNAQDTIYIDPANTNDPAQDGSYSNPYDSWDDLSLSDNSVYLFKRGEVLEVSGEAVLDYLNDVTLGAYGTGERPRISTSSVFVKGCESLVIENLEIFAGGSHCIEFTHNHRSKNVTIENCEIHSPTNWEVDAYNYGISAGADHLKIIDSEIYNIYRDGLYFDHATNIEVINCYIHDVNQRFFDTPDNAGGDGIQFVDSDSLLVRETVIDRSGTGKKFCIIVTNPDENLEVTDVLFEDNHFIGPDDTQYGGAVLFLAADNMTLRRNVIEDGPQGVYTHCENILINNNIILNSGTGVAVASNQAEIYNNVLYGNDMAVHSSNHPSTIRNNIVYLTDPSQGGFNDSECTTDHNLQNISSTEVPWHDAETIDDPLFVDVENHDFHLQEGSPAIDNGIDVGIAYDHEKREIPCGGTPDIGAYEYQGNCDSPSNREPVADAGEDKVVDEGDLVQLDGSDSYDPDQDSLEYNWESPGMITLSDVNASKPNFEAPDLDSDTTVYFELTVSDGDFSSDPDTVAVEIDAVVPVNHTPVADAGENKSVDEGKKVQLDGSGSYDSDKDSLAYNWNAPDLITLSNPSAVKPTFEAPELDSDTTIYVSLKVSDRIDVSSPDTVVIDIKNTEVVNNMPVADAGIDQAVQEGEWVDLDGSQSNDPDNDSLYFNWESPESITLSDPSAVQPYFEAPDVKKETSYLFFLSVSDGSLESAKDTVEVTVNNVATGLSDFSGDREQAFVVYPNPTYGQLNIQLKTNREINGLTIKVYSISGKLERIKSYRDQMNEGSIVSVGISKLSAGMYILTAQSENRIIFRTKVTKK